MQRLEVLDLNEFWLIFPIISIIMPSGRRACGNG
jgi:hypothetical protein